MNWTRFFIFSIFFFILITSDETSDTIINFIHPMTGRYVITNLSDLSTTYYDLNNPTSLLVIRISGQFKVKHEFNLPNNLLNKDLIIDIGRINETVSLFWNGKLAGKAGEESPNFCTANWQNWRFFIPAGWNRSRLIRLDYYFETRSISGGFKDHIPCVYSLDQFKLSGGLIFTDDSLKRYGDKCRTIMDTRLVFPGTSIMLNPTFMESGMDYSHFDLDAYRKTHSFFYLPESISITPLYLRYPSAGRAILVYNQHSTYRNQQQIKLDSIFFRSGRLEGDQSRVYTDYYHSAITGQTRPFGVYLPPGYFKNHGQCYPVIYGFGGGSEIHLTLIQGDLPTHYDQLIQTGKVPSFILITLQGSQGSSFMNGHLPHQDFEGSFIRELIPEVSARYRIMSGRNHQNLMGLSLGGLAAVSIGLRYPQRFHSVVSIAGVLQGAPDSFPEKNPFTIIEQPPDGSYPALLITAGDKDELRLNYLAEKFHHSLLIRKIPHQYFQFPGGHHHNEWQTDLPKILNFMLH